MELLSNPEGQGKKVAEQPSNGDKYPRNERPLCRTAEIKIGTRPVLGVRRINANLTDKQLEQIGLHRDI